MNSRDKKLVENTMREYNRFQRKERSTKINNDEDLYLFDQSADPIIIIDLGDGNGLGPDGDIYKIVSTRKENKP